MKFVLFLSVSLIVYWFMNFYATFQTKTFIMLINGLRNGLDLINDLQRADHGVSALYKVVDIPTLSSLRESIRIFEEEIQQEFPCYQVNM